MRARPEEARAHIGFVFQYAALFDSMSVKENILFGVKRKRRLTGREQEELTRALLEDVGMSGTEERRTSELSCGMMKRVGLARALAMRPEVLLFDEPTSGLDPVTAYSIDQLIVETRDKTHAACVVVSHDLNSVMRVADLVVFLHAGRVIFRGGPSEFVKAKNCEIRELVYKAQAESLTL